MPADSLGRGRKHTSFPIERQWRHGIWLLARTLEWIRSRLSGHADLPFGFGVERPDVQCKPSAAASISLLLMTQRRGSWDSKRHTIDEYAINHIR